MSTLCTIISDGTTTFFLVPTKELRKKRKVFKMNGRHMYGDMSSYPDRIEIHECFGIGMEKPLDPEYAQSFKKYQKVVNREPLFSSYRQQSPFSVDPSDPTWTIMLQGDS